MNKLSSVSISKSYEYDNGLDTHSDWLANLHTNNAIYASNGYSNTDNLHAMHNKRFEKLSERDTIEKLKKLKNLGIEELNCDVFLPRKKRKTEITDTAANFFQEISGKEELPIVDEEIIDKSNLHITFTNGKEIKIHLDDLPVELIEEIEVIIKSHIDAREKCSANDIIKSPLLNFLKPMKSEVELLEKIREAYYNLEFSGIFENIANECDFINMLDGEKCSIYGKKSIENWLNMMTIKGKKENWLCQGMLVGELDDFGNSLISLEMHVRNRQTRNIISYFILHIELNEDRKIRTVEKRNCDIYSKKYMPTNVIMQEGIYSDYASDSQ